jgi:hypothetical protein
MAMKGMQNTIIRSGGWVLVLLGMMFGISACDQYFLQTAKWGIALGIVFVTLVFTFILLSIEMPKIGKIDIPLIKRILFIVFLVVDVLFVVLGFVFDQGFANQAYVMLLGMVLMALVFKLEKDAIEKNKVTIGVVFLVVEVVLAIIASLSLQVGGVLIFIAFLASGITGVIGWNYLQSIFWNQKKASIILLAIAIILAWVCGIVTLLAGLSWICLLWPILMTLGDVMVLGIEMMMRKKKLLVYIK